MDSFFNLLKTFQDKNKHNVTCAEEYMNKNQMTVISTVTKSAYDLWNTAHCGDCYQNLSDPNHQYFSYHFGQIIKLHDVYKNCTHKNPQTVCKDCMEDYMNLNILFEDQKKKRELCFDLVDIVSNCLYCCHLYI
jgi:Osteopetrosis-associated transmembrane protein 1 precursor